MALFGSISHIWLYYCVTLYMSTNVIMASVVPGIGVNWGTMASHPLPPTIIVNLLKDNGITKVKLFDADAWTVGALAGSGIEVMVGIPNNQLHHLAKHYDNAKDWVKENITKHFKDDVSGVNIKYVAVGNEPFLKSYNGTYDKTLFPALQHIQKALSEKGLGDKIKATVPLNADIYASPSNKPSDGIFRSDVKDLMVQVAKFLLDNRAPFVVNIYPFLSLYQTTGFPMEYAFFDGGSSKPVNDGNITYQNVFDANYDTLVWTLHKNGLSGIKILVGEVGWPTDGFQYATMNYAQKFYNGLMKKLGSNKGTPLRPGRLDVYLFGLIDEDQKSIAPGQFERHWGLFRYDGQPKFPVDLSGKGNDKMLVAAKGVQYLPSQWCILSPDTKDMSKIPSEISYACSMSDCTSLGYGSSCNHLDSHGNVSYAFNMYYQMNDQDVEACNFGGLATIVKQNASRGTCLFPVQIVSAGHRLYSGYLISIVASVFFFIFHFNVK